MLTKTKLPFKLAATILVLLLLLGSISSWYILTAAIKNQSQQSFEKSALALVDQIDENLQLEIDTIFGVRGLFAASQSVDRNEFKQFAQTLDIKNRLPGTETIEYVSVVARNDLTAFIESVALDTSLDALGYPNFAVFPNTNSEKLYIVNYIFPFEENRDAFGYDLGSNPSRLGSLYLALEINGFVMSEPSELLQLGKDEIGVLFFLPIYQNNTLQASQSQRQATLVGYAVSVINLQQMMQNIEVEVPDSLRQFRITDVTDSETVAYQSSQYDGISNLALHTTSHEILFGERIWRIDFASNRSYATSLQARNGPTVILILGLAITVLVGLYLARIVKTNKIANNKAIIMTEELRRSEEELAKRNRQLDTANNSLMKYVLATENASEGIIFTNTDGSIEYVNNSWLAMTGYAKNEVLGKNPRLVNSGETSAQEYSKMWQQLNSGKNYHNPNILNRRKDGSLFNTDLTIYPVKKDSGEYFYVGIYRDVTEEIALDEARNDFIGIASHQLRTPLSGLRWYVESLLKLPREELGEKTVKYIEKIGKSAERMRLLVESLLNISRLDLNTFIIEPQPTEIRTIFDSVSQDIAPKAEAKDIKLNVNVDDKLPAINFDTSLIEMIIENLVSNAVKYTPQGGEVEISAILHDTASDDRNHPANVMLTVRDTGYGIPENEQDKIFTKMFRASNVQELAAGGTGLGLYIVQQIVEKTGGKIWFESTPNKGTTFFVTFPLTGMHKKAGKAKLSL